MKDKLYFVNRYHDAAVLLSIFLWRGWSMLRDAMMIKSYSMKGFYLMLFKDTLSTCTEVFAGPLRFIYNHRFGTRSTGLIILLVTILSMVFTTVLWNTFSHEKFLSEFWGLIRLFFVSIWNLITNKPVDWGLFIGYYWSPFSVVFKYFVGVVLVFGLFHVFAIYFGYGDRDNRFKKGTSLLFTVLRRRVPRLGEEYYAVLVQPVLAALAGLMVYEFDPLFAVWLWIAAGCLFIQEFADFLYRRTL